MAKKGKKIIPGAAVPPEEGRTLTIDGKDYLELNDAMHTFYRRSMGELSSFFLALRDEKKVLASKCSKCGIVRVPPMAERCPDCNFAETGLIEVADTALSINLYTTTGILVPGIFNKGTKIKLVYRDKRVGRITDVFGLPASELSDEQLATEGLQEKEINWEAAVEPKLPKATAKAKSAFEKAFKQMKKVAADMNDCERAKKDIAGWKRNILVKTPGGRCVIAIDNGEIAIKKGGTTKQDFVMAAKNPNTILNGLAYKGSLTEAIMMADLWISKNIEFMTVFKLERMARSLARSRK
jgi:hypothetical protein